MSDISAVYILQYLSNLNTIIHKHKKLYLYMKKKIKVLSGVKLYPNFGSPILSCFPLLFEKYTDDIRLNLLEEGIYCRKYYKPLQEKLISTNFYNRILCLPCTIEMTNEDIDHILLIIAKSLK